MVNNNTKKEMKRVVALSKQDIYFMIVILMLALVMYWTGIVVQPTLDIAKKEQEQTDLAIKQQNEIISHQNNNTQQIQQLIDTQDQIIQAVQNQSNVISEAVQYFSDNINQTYFQLENTERQRSMQILNNITSMRGELNGTLDKLDSIANGTGLTAQEKNTTRNILVDIREELERLEVESAANPVQRQTTIPAELQEQLKGQSGGQISSAGEPVVVNQTISTPISARRIILLADGRIQTQQYDDKEYIICYSACLCSRPFCFVNDSGLHTARRQCHNTYRRNGGGSNINRGNTGEHTIHNRLDYCGNGTSSA